MPQETLQKQKMAEDAKCTECGERYATKDDQLCDSCRYSLTLENIIKNRK